MPKAELSDTSYVVLGQLALREWASSYELAKSIGRTLRFFWPRAERMIYVEAKRLARLGYTEAHVGQVGGRRRTGYYLTASGRKAVSSWLRRPTSPFALELEPLVRVHLLPLADEESLERAFSGAEVDAEAIRAAGRAVVAEFLAGTHAFQDEAYFRALIFDFLWSFADLLQGWAQRSRAEVAGWQGLDPATRNRRAVEAMAQAVAARIGGV